LALDVATALKTSQQDFKVSYVWSVRFVCQKGLAVCQRTTIAQKFHAEYLEKLIGYQHHAIIVY